MRAMSWLLTRSPGTIAYSPDLAALKASSLTSNRNFALRSFSSGPWHLKQLSERIGLMSRLKSMVGVDDVLVAASATMPAASQIAAIVMGVFFIIACQTSSD